MQSPRRSLTIILLGSLLSAALVACGADDLDGGAAPARSAQAEAAAPTPATEPPEPPKPSFNRKLLLGNWDTSIDDPENGIRLDLKVEYRDEDFSIRGTVTMADPSNPVSDDLKSFVVTGTWTLEGETLTETATESTFPLWRVGVASPATVKTLDESTFAFERSGARMTFTRI